MQCVVGDLESSGNYLRLKYELPPSFHQSEFGLLSEVILFVERYLGFRGDWPFTTD